MDYIRFNETVRNSGELIPSNQFRETLKKRYNLNPESDFYTSLFYFNNEAKKYFEENGKSVAGFKGNAESDYLLFDLDNTDLEKVKEDTLSLLNKLKSTFTLDDTEIQKYVRVFFSGNKGFHVYVDIQQRVTPAQMKNICGSIAGDLESFDSVIYNTNRLVRALNTKHQKSKLFKVFLDYDWFLEATTEDIFEKAKFQTKPLYANERLDVSHLLNSTPPESAKNGPKTEYNEIRGLDAINFKKTPHDWPRCIYALSHGVMVPGKGQRSRIFLRLATFLRNQGFDKEGVYGFLKATARKNKKLYPEADLFSKEEIWNTSIKSAFNDDTNFSKGSWGVDPDSEDGKLLKEYCDAVGEVTDKKCTLHHSTKKSRDAVNIDEVYKSFSSFAKNIDKNRVFTGIKSIDNHMKILKGTTNILIGAAGCGKTTMCLNIMENANYDGIYTMFFSMDMTKDSIYLKLAQKHSDYEQDEILDLVKNEELEKVSKIRKTISEKYCKTFFDFSSALSFENIKEKIFNTERKNNCKIGFVVIDYASRISSEYGDSHANAKYNALKSKEVADETDTAMLILCQISRQSGDGSSPIRTKRAAKDAGDWEEASQNVITMWRPFMGMDGVVDDEGNEYKDDVMKVFLAKNRMGNELEFPLHWKPKKGQIEDLEPNEIDIYQREVEPLERKLRKEKFGRN